MAVNIDFNVWANGAGASVTASNQLPSSTGAQSTDYIYANIFNGILKDLSLVTVGLIGALADDYTATSMTFNNSQTPADIKANIKTLLYNRNAKTADKWKTARSFTITDYDNTGVGATTVSVDGSGDITLKMPQAFKGSLAGNAATATKWASSIPVAISDYSGTNTGATSAVQGAEINTIVLKLPEQLNCHYDRITHTSSATHYITAVQSAAAGNHPAKVLANLSYVPSTNTLSTNISGNANKFNISNVERLINTSLYVPNAIINTFDYYVPAIYFVTYRSYGTGCFNIMFITDGQNNYTDGQYGVSVGNGNTTTINKLRLKFTVQDSSHTCITFQYSTDHGSTWNDCTSGHDEFFVVTRIVCA